MVGYVVLSRRPGSDWTAAHLGRLWTWDEAVDEAALRGCEEPDMEWAVARVVLGEDES